MFPLPSTDRVRAAWPGVWALAFPMRRADTPVPGTASGSASAVPPGADLETLMDMPVARAYRDLSWRLGIDPTKRRPSGEALARRLLSGSALPTIHPLVDAYNRASGATLVPLSAFDAERVAGRLTFDTADAGEAFEGIARGPETLTGRELVYRDAAGVAAVFLYRDATRTSMRPDTTRALVVACGVPGLPDGAVEGALARVEEEAGRVAWVGDGGWG